MDLFLIILFPINIYKRSPINKLEDVLYLTEEDVKRVMVRGKLLALIAFTYITWIISQLLQEVIFLKELHFIFHYL